MAVILAELIKEIQAIFDEANLAEAKSETRVFLREIAGIELAEQLAKADKMISRPQYKELIYKAKRRAKREPLAYIKGEAWFFGRSFLIAPGLLVPRADSEILIEAALALLAKRQDQQPKILDSCCGTGCLGLTLLAEIKARKIAASLTLVDNLALACEFAQKNAKKLGLDRDTVVEEADLWPQLKGSEGKGDYDLIICNPPYIPRAEIKDLMPEVSIWEDPAALDGGEDGLDFYRRIKEEYSSYLAPDGLMIIELGAGQKKAVFDLFSPLEQKKISWKKDYGGIDRALIFNSFEAEDNCRL